jgi:molybdopterin converting factor small subunit
VSEQETVISVKVYASGFCSFKHIDEEGFMTLPEGASLNDVCRRLKIPFLLRRILFAAVNYEHVKLSTKLKNGDVVSVISPMAGG